MMSCLSVRLFSNHCGKFATHLDNVSWQLDIRSQTSFRTQTRLRSFERYFCQELDMVNLFQSNNLPTSKICLGIIVYMCWKGSWNFATWFHVIYHIDSELGLNESQVVTVQRHYWTCSDSWRSGCGFDTGVDWWTV